MLEIFKGSVIGVMFIDSQYMLNLQNRKWKYEMIIWK
jgi:hypothetical protein